MDSLVVVVAAEVGARQARARVALFRRCVLAEQVQRTATRTCATPD